MKTRNSILNMCANIGYYLLTILLGILNRKAVVVFLGIEYQGVNGLFNSVITMLSIAELGLGTAVVSSLYAPVKDDDTGLLKAMMHFYRRCYMYIAGVILLAGILLVPVLPLLVRDYEAYSIPYSLTFVYFWFLADSAASYIFAHRRSLLIADQRNYLIMAADAAYLTLMKLTQIVILWKTGSFCWFLAAMLAFRLLDNVFVWHISEKRYPWLKERDAGSLSKDVQDTVTYRVKGAFFHKIGSFVVMGTDNILITRFLGLVITGIYSNYNLVITAIRNICSKMISATTASIGHMLLEKDQDNTVEIYRELQLINVFVTNCAATGIFCVITPLIAWIFGEQYVIDRRTVLVLALNFALQCMRNVFMAYKEAAGILYEDRMVPLLESVINIVASLILLRYFGLAGIFMGTIISTLLLYGYTYPVLIFKGILKLDIREYVREFFWVGATIAATIIAGGAVCNRFVPQSGLRGVIIRSMIAVTTALILTSVLYAVWKQETKNMLVRIQGILQKIKAELAEAAERHHRAFETLTAILIAFCYFILIPPTRIDYVEVFDKYDVYFRVLAVAGIWACYLVFIGKDFLKDRFLKAFMLYSCTLIFSSIVMHGDIKVAVWGSAIVPASIIMLTHMCIRWKKRMTVNILFYMYIVLALINLYTVWKYPAAYVKDHVEDMNDYYLLGNYNRFIDYYVIVLLIGYYGLRRKLIRGGKTVYPLFWLVCIYSSIKMRAVTTSVGLVMWAAFVALNRFVDMTYISNIVNAVILNIIAFVVLQKHDPEKNGIITVLAGMFGKKAHFTGRYWIWDNSRRGIMESPIIGHGFPFDYLDKIGIEHCHCTFLTILYERGIVGMFLFGYVLYTLARDIYTGKDRKLQCAYCAWIFILMVMTQFETYRIIFLVLYGALMSYFSIYDCKKETTLSVSEI